MEAEYENKCDFCPRRFKTLRGMRIHRCNCPHNYNTTEKAFELDEIIGVYGDKENRWFKVQWTEHDPDWQREHLLNRDGCQQSIRNFWAKSGLNPNKPFYPDPDQAHRCRTCGKCYSRAQDLKAHYTRTGHDKDNSETTTATAERDAITEKRKEMQKLLPKVKWGNTEG